MEAHGNLVIPTVSKVGTGAKKDVQYGTGFEGSQQVSEITPQHESDIALNQLRLEARAAILSLRSLSTSVKQYFVLIDTDLLNLYKKPRILALIDQANAIIDVPLARFQSSPSDLARVIDSCSRKADWLNSILWQCDDILKYE